MRRRDRRTSVGDTRRDEERRVEARLSGALRQLDDACLYHLNTLTREQRRLHRDLDSLRTGNLWRKGTPDLQPQPWSRELNQLIQPYKRTWLPVISQSGRGPDKPCLQKLHSMDTRGNFSSLQARIREFIGSREPQVEGSALTVCLPDLSGQTTDRPSTAELAMKKGQNERRTDEDTGTQKVGEVNLLSTMPPALVLALDGRLRTVHTLPSFAQALSEARKARYLRHRGQPLCERELTVREIFASTPSDI